MTRRYDRKAQLETAQRAVPDEKVDPIVQSILDFWAALGRPDTPAEPLARRWRAGSIERTKQWAALKFAHRHAIYRKIDRIRDPRPDDIKKKAAR